MAYGPRTWGILDNKGKFTRLNKFDLITECEKAVGNNLLERLAVGVALKKAFDITFDFRPAYIGINLDKSYIGMWKAGERETTYQQFYF